MNNKIQLKSLGDVRVASWENGIFGDPMEKGAVLHFIPAE